MSCWIRKINISDDKRITCSVGVADGRIFEGSA